MSKDTLILNTKNYVIKNTTLYDPTEVVSKFLNGQLMSCDKASEIRIVEGFGGRELAAQDLFVRAVRAVEKERNENLMIKIMVPYSFLLVTLYNTSLVSPFWLSLLQTVVTSVLFYLFNLLLLKGLAELADYFEINIQYSI